ncbi:MAG: hypothetical protein EA359_15075 [Balneolaceae bacterium]|nr:MAG: hypothetical protein EA359_15075 [Balneolaceae bacterium]
MNELILITLIIMLGILLSVIAWQVFSVGKTAMKIDEKRPDYLQLIEDIKEDYKQLRTELQILKTEIENKKG